MKRVVICILLSLACCPIALADGGRLRFSKAAGPFLVTLFTTPEPLTPGPADFSVMVQDASSGSILSDAQVVLTLTPADASSPPLIATATHGIATNRILQAAEFNLPKSGVWKLHLDIRDHTQSATIDTPIEIEKGSRKLPLIWIFATLPLLAILLFTLHQRQKLRLARHSDLSSRPQRSATLSSRP
jgi:hypothetical protein